MNDSNTIFIVDDDPAVRDSLTGLLKAAGYAVEAYPDAEAFLAAYDPCRPGCLILDMQMPGMGGLGLQAVLAEREDSRPIIFLTAHATVPTTILALKKGAFDFLEKPTKGKTLLAHVRNALQQDAESRRIAADLAQARMRCATLTQREREVLQLLIAGNSNKDIGQRLGISHRTVELHRMHIMQKTGTQNVIELAAITRAAGISSKALFGDDAPSPETR
jgi:FixJ family two-component response regulator